MAIGECREDYLKTIYSLTLMNGSVRQSEIAEYMGLSRPSVSVAVRSLEEDGYVICEGRNIQMTHRGESIAKKMYARHLFFTKLLVQAGVLKKRAEKEACRMEHVLSEDSYQKLKHLLEAITG
ncbi:MAG: metal-dependent transcriptional regulator [Eubacteriales bacterium]|nr:metal-dependent transcriptional regulator [Eubacteriales bacterium]